ncbi:MAG: hypothetical protein WCX61_04190 [Candidatus Peribacteraceae bacterium]|jgi:hypothetical protein
MRNCKHTLLVVVAIVILIFATEAKAQDVRQLTAQAQWMTAASSWMNIAGQNNAQAKIAEAEAKIIAAQAAMVTAKAGADKTHAEASQIREQIRSLSLDNDLKKATVYYGKRAMHATYNSLAQSKSQPTRDDLIRQSQQYAPKRLTKEQLDPDSGKINWPAILQQDRFLEHRVQLDSLFAKYHDSSLDIRGEVQSLSEEMRDELKLLVQEVSPAEYMEAQQFIRSLAYESQCNRSQQG